MIKKIGESLKQQADKAIDSVSVASGKRKDMGASRMDQAKDAMGLLRDKLNDVKDIDAIKLIPPIACQPAIGVFR
jgi:hypothetical protein